MSLVGGKNTPSFSVTQGSAQDISNATATKLAFNTEVFDTDSAFDHSSNYRFTPGVAGKYFLFSSNVFHQKNSVCSTTYFLFEHSRSEKLLYIEFIGK